eukprot:TRINITY_DN28918_c0_g1_i1.p1 TRINITY_DN28918_c0_g1~~TRINITY_DN28918_c0_g1_i1.p1  ORF type:complete len:560 (+),score=155.48 TRINITY_DN28918_c0_g1_i1:65-1681(+)
MSGLRVFTVHGTRFELPPRYELARARDQERGQGAQGYGAFGAVCEVWDSVTQEAVMVKKIQGIFARPTADSARFVRELRLLTALTHPGVVQVLDAFPPTTRKETGGRREIPLAENDPLSDVYVVTRRYDATLLQVIRSKQTLEKGHVRVFAAQVLSALRYLHECGVAHTRLCPANILCDMDCNIAIGDFGAAEPCTGVDTGFRRERDEIPLWPEKERTAWGGFDTDERSEVWYKAPEILLRAPKITPEVDIWSAGCIIAELLNRRPLFPGISYAEQLRLITDFCGVREPEAVHTRAQRPGEPIERVADGPDMGRFLGESADANESRRFLLSMAPKGKVPVRTAVPAADKFVSDLLQKMLRFGPTQRSSAQELQTHPLFTTGTGPANHDEVAVWRSPQARQEPLGCQWKMLEGAASGSPQSAVRVVLVGVTPGSLAEQAGLGRFLGYRVVRLSRDTAREHAHGQQDKGSDRIDGSSLDEGKGRLWVEEHPGPDASQRVLLRFSTQEVCPLETGWAVPLHMSTQQQLNSAIWDCLRRFCG